MSFPISFFFSFRRFIYLLLLLCFLFLSSIRLLDRIHRIKNNQRQLPDFYLGLNQRTSLSPRLKLIFGFKETRYITFLFLSSIRFLFGFKETIYIKKRRKKRRKLLCTIMPQPDTTCCVVMPQPSMLRYYLL